MTDAATEQAHWDELVQSPAGVDYEVWAETDWNSGVTLCLDAITPRFRDAPIGTVLDLGCGVGRLTLPLARQFPGRPFVGLDISENMLDEARFRCDVDNIRWIHGDGRTIPDEVGPLAIAYSVVTFQHMPAEAVAGYIKAVGALLVKRGAFVFQFPEGDDDVPMSHNFQKAQVSEWCEAAGLSCGFSRQANGFPNWVWTTAVKS